MALCDENFTGLIPIDEVAPEELHRIESFSSGTPSLDDFLKREAADLHAEHLSHTSLIFHSDFDGLVGYITLANDAIPLAGFEIGELGLNCNTALKTFPAVKICRLAVHKDLQRGGIGRRIIELAVGEIVGAQTVTTARIMITDAINEPKVIAFYQRYGFEESIWATDFAKNNQRGKIRATIKMIRDIYALK